MGDLCNKYEKSVTVITRSQGGGEVRPNLMTPFQSDIILYVQNYIIDMHIPIFVIKGQNESI